MPAGKQSRGTCSFCGHETTKGSIHRHLKSCPKRQEQITAAEQSQQDSEDLYHLRVYDKDATQFWLDLEVRGQAKLKDLDSYLRAIWLECCGHLSRFSLDGWGSDEIAMNRRVAQVFNEGITIHHIYDFGTSSETLLQYIGKRQGKALSKKPIYLMARNILPEVQCMECDQPATYLCMECFYESPDVYGELCKKHAKTHPHDNYGDPMPIVNSPRVGMCGYEGPANPPY